jgi:hypothetical protein
LEQRKPDMMMETGLDAKDELIQALREELETVITEEWCSAVYTGANAPKDADPESNLQQRTVMQVLARSVRTQRLYFIIRSTIMSLISALITLIVVLYLGTINVTQAVLLGIIVFIIALITSRLLDKQIIQTTKKIIHQLNKHKKLRNFILNQL